MADDVVFQSTTPATPAAGTRIAAEEVTNLNAGAVTAQLLQRLALALITANGTAVDVSVAHPLPVDDDATQTALGLILTELGQKLEPGDLAALATAANQATIISGLSSIDGHVDGLEGKDYATSAKQDALKTVADAIAASVAGATPAGTNAIGKLAANSGVDIGDVDVTSLPALPAGTNSIGTVALAASTPVQFLDVDETEDEVKATAGTLHGYFLANRSAGERFVKFYDGPAASIAVGTDTPKLTIPLAAGEKANLALPRGLAFASGICIAATTGFAVADTGAPGTNDVIADVFYA